MTNLVDEVLVHCAECPTLLAHDYIGRATTKLLENIGLDQQTRHLITLAGKRNYPADALDGREMVSVLAVTLDGSPVMWSTTGEGIRLAECPSTSNQQLAITLTVKPNNSDSKTEEYQQAIRDFALYRLLMIPQQRWTNINLAQHYLFSFNALKAKLSASNAASEISQRGSLPIMKPAYKWV